MVEDNESGISVSLREAVSCMPRRVSIVFCMDMKKEEDIKFMRMARDLAEKGVGGVNPNPLVGAVIVRDGRVIGEGWHERSGCPHAERNALKNCTEDPAGATMYVTLEPCCHHGKTPPCTEAILQNGISRVVAGVADPNPLVAGKGLRILAEAGVEVECGLMEEELRWQNRVFFKYMEKKMPWVAMKTAMSADGKTASRTGESKWISCPESRAYVHGLRNRFMAVMCGSGTIANDDPMLNCRLDGAVRQPVRIAVDSRLSIDPGCRLVKTAGQYRTIVACTPERDRNAERALLDCGAEVLVCGSRNGRVDLADLFVRLGAMGIDSVLVEGGGTLNWTIYDCGLADELYLFVAPGIIGGAAAPTPVDGAGFESPSRAAGLEFIGAEKIGADYLLRAKKCSLE